VGWGGVGYRVENKGTCEFPKTSFKDNTIDDEAFAEFREVFAKACERISGKLPNKNQKENWRELAELLVMELEIASARTKNISNIPAFLTEHLRRRLLSKPEKAKSKTNKSLQISKQKQSKVIETFQAESLTKQGRESTLKTFIGYIEKGQTEFLMGLHDTYTKEDWEWLLENLAIEKMKNQ
jgi:hypothetical protein